MPHNTEPQNDLVNHIMNDFADHESRLRAIIAYARSEGSEPKERYTQAIEAAYAALINKAKVEERKQIESDMDGKTFSEFTDWKQEYERIAIKNGRRIEQLESQIKEGS